MFNFVLLCPNCDYALSNIHINISSSEASKIVYFKLKKLALKMCKKHHFGMFQKKRKVICKTFWVVL